MSLKCEVLPGLSQKFGGARRFAGYGSAIPGLWSQQRDRIPARESQLSTDEKFQQPQWSVPGLIVVTDSQPE